MTEELAKAIAEANPVLQNPDLMKLSKLHDATFELLSKLGLSPSTLDEKRMEHVKDFMSKVSKL